MAHKDFENIVQSRFQDFESKPPESVWSNINAFRDRRKKRLLFLWWLLPILAIAGSGVALYSANASDSSELKTQYSDNQINYGNSSNLKVDTELTAEKPKNKETKTVLPTRQNKSESRTVIRAEIPAPTTTNPNSDPVIADRITLSKMEGRVMQLPMQERVPEQREFHGNSFQNRHSWQKRIGLDIGSFLTISKTNAKISPPPNSLFNQLEGAQNATYHRFFEIAPYIKLIHVPRGFDLQARLLYSATNISVMREYDLYFGNQKSFGFGIGSGYTFIHRKFEAAVFLQLQGESITTQYTNGNSYPWFTADPGGTSIPNNNQYAAPSGYRQWVVSGEAGVRFEYQLRNPLWRLNAGVGYRNYFWQQSKPSENDGVIELPQLLHTRLGLTYQF